MHQLSQEAMTLLQQMCKTGNQGEIDNWLKRCIALIEEKLKEDGITKERIADLQELATSFEYVLSESLDWKQEFIHVFLQRAKQLMAGPN
jgi:hypothetical protein